MINLQSQIVLITGGSRGIGAATALLFARAGANVAITYRKNRDAASSIVRKIRSLNCDALAIQCPVEDYRKCAKSVEKVLEAFGRIDVLVNNASIWEEGIIGKMTPAEWHRSVDINLTGTFNMCNIVVPAMKERRYGRIINIASTAGQRGEAYHSHYAASKGGIIAFTKSIAVELIRFGIWVNCLAPGWVDTDMVSHVFKNSRQKNEICKSIPRGRPAIAEEIAGPILFLASPLSDNIVGEILNVNGGSVLCG